MRGNQLGEREWRSHTGERRRHVQRPCEWQGNGINDRVARSAKFKVRLSFHKKLKTGKTRLLQIFEN